MGYKHRVEDIIEKGMDLFRTKGYHSVGINQILKECEIPKGSFYNFFDSKEDFASKVVNAYGEQSLEMIRGMLSNKDLAPLVRLKSFYKMLIDANEEDNFNGGCLINTISNEIGHTNENIGKEANKQFLRWVNEIAECVQEAQDAGEITTAYSANEIAEYLHAGLNGAFSRMKVTHSRTYLDKWFRITFDFIKK